MGQWLDLKTHAHDVPQKWNQEVGVGSTWQCSCERVFVVTDCKKYKGEVLRGPYWILSWKPVEE